MSKIENDKVAVVHYKGTFPEDGEEFDSSHGGEPLSYLVGHNGMVAGFEKEMMGAEVGESRSFTLVPEDAYGDHNEEAVIDIPRNEFPDDIELELGMILMSDHGPFRTVAVTDDLVRCDFNHPLAGRALSFDVEVVDVRDPTEDEMSHGHAHGPDGEHQH